MSLTDSEGKLMHRHAFIHWFIYEYGANLLMAVFAVIGHRVDYIKKLQHFYCHF